MKLAKTILEAHKLLPSVSPAARNQRVSNKSPAAPEKKNITYSSSAKGILRLSAGRTVNWRATNSARLYQSRPSTKAAAFDSITASRSSPAKTAGRRGATVDAGPRLEDRRAEGAAGVAGSTHGAPGLNAGEQRAGDLCSFTVGRFPFPLNGVERAAVGDEIHADWTGRERSGDRRRALHTRASYAALCADQRRRILGGQGPADVEAAVQWRAAGSGAAASGTGAAGAAGPTGAHHIRTDPRAAPVRREAGAVERGRTPGHTGRGNP